MVPNFLIRWIVNGVALWVAAKIIPGITVQNDVALIAAALVLGLVNALIKPILQLLTLPVIILTLGLFTFVINAVMLLLTSWIAGLLGIGFNVDGFLPALLGALVVSIVSLALNLFIRE
ncbi:MAG: phage holin family protein [Chloroflexi bacterium]|nr:phage holin family protein [Chloroflexota bacterium]